MQDDVPPLLSWVLGATLQGSFAILLVRLLAPVFRGAAGARAAFLLWAVVLLRLLVPGLPSSPIAWLQPALAPDVAPSGSSRYVVTVTTTDAPPVSATFVGGKGDVRPPSDFPLTVWALGAMGVLGFAAIRGVRASLLVRRARDVTGSPEFYGVLGAFFASGTGPRICETLELKSPALCGIVRPVILLPVGWRRHFSQRELECVLLHEIGHLRRGDLLWRWAFLAAQAVHWFNPLVWLAGRAARLHQEMACDEWVLRNGAALTAGVYGETLIASARRFAAGRFSMPIQAGMAESKAGLKCRIRHLAAIRPRGRTSLVACVLAAAVLVVLTGPARSRASADGPQAPAFHAEPVADAGGAALPPPPVPRGGPATQVRIESKFVQLSPDAAEKLLRRSGDGKAMGLLSVYGRERFVQVLRAMQNLKGIDLMTAPTVTTKLGNKAIIDVVREFRYPTEFESPKSIKGPSGESLVVPATPSQFGTRNVGVELEVQPVSAKDDVIDLDVSPNVTEFLGFTNFGASRDAKVSLDGDPLSDKFNPSGAGGVINQPIFSVRNITTQISLKSGETALIGGVQADAFDLQSFSKLGSQNPDKSSPSSRLLYIFVTAQLVDREGRPAAAESSSAVEPVAFPGPAAASSIPADARPSGIPAPGRPGFVKSPYDPEAGYVDVRGYAAGTEVKDPFSGRMFVVPPMPATTPPP